MGGSEYSLADGPANPGYPLTSQYAGFWSRAAALLIDIIAVSIAMSFLPSSFGIPGDSMLFFVVLLIYTVLGSAQGVTLGKRALGLRVVNKDGAAPGLTSGIVRVVAEAVSATLGLGYLWMLWDKDKQTWHDKIARTYVVRMRAPRRKGGAGEARRPVRRYRGD